MSAPMLVRPRFISLDTAQLADWSRDATSNQFTLCERAKNFERELLSGGLVVVITTHHVEELLRTQNEEMADKCYRHLARLPVVAWPRSQREPQVLGTVISLMAAEVHAAHKSGCTDAVEVRNLVRPSLLKVGTGAEAMGPFAEWRQFRHLWREHETEQQEIVAISRSGAIPQFTKMSLGKIRRYRLTKPEEGLAQLSTMVGALASDIKQRGDKRIGDPGNVAARFASQVTAQIATMQFTNVESLITRTIELAGMTTSDVGDDTLLGDILAEAEYQKRLHLAAELLDIGYQTLKASVPKKALPSWIIDHALRTFEQDLQERTGSIMNDYHLACLSPYIDTLFVDKRTQENIRRASQKDAEFRSIIGFTVKSSHYTNDLQKVRR